MAGMFIIIVVLLGVVAWVFQNNVRQAQLISAEAAHSEVRSNRLAILRNVVERSYMEVEPKHRATWEAALREKLGPRYGMEVALVQDSAPPYAIIEDRTYGMASRFYLPSGRS